MIIKLTEEEQKNCKIKFVNKVNRPSNYIKERDSIWHEHVVKGEKLGKKFWNGMLYSFEGINQYNQMDPIIYLSNIEYSDYLFKKKMGSEYIVNKYGKEQLPRNCGVDVILVTSDKKIVVGKKEYSVNLESDLYGHISGNMNEDEIKVEQFSDIQKTMKMEIEEESNIKVVDSKLVFHQIMIFNSYAGFEFIYYLDTSSDEINMIHKKGEFLTFEAFSPKELIGLKGVSGFEFSKRYIADII